MASSRGKVPEQPKDNDLKNQGQNGDKARGNGNLVQQKSSLWKTLTSFFGKKDPKPLLQAYILTSETTTATKAFEQAMEEKMGKQNITLKRITDDRPELNPDAPIYLVCNNYSRLFNDVERCLQEFKTGDSRRTILIVLHVSSKANLPKTTSKVLLEASDVANKFPFIIKIIDMAFLNQKIYECEMNTVAFKELDIASREITKTDMEQGQYVNSSFENVEKEQEVSYDPSNHGQFASDTNKEGGPAQKECSQAQSAIYPKNVEKEQEVSYDPSNHGQFASDTNKEGGPAQKECTQAQSAIYPNNVEKEQEVSYDPSNHGQFASDTNKEGGPAQKECTQAQRAIYPNNVEKEQEVSYDPSNHGQFASDTNKEGGPAQKECTHAQSAIYPNSIVSVEVNPKPYKYGGSA